MDLSYVTPRIVALAGPAPPGAPPSTPPRDSLADVAAFFEARHGGHYAVFNVAAEPERAYDAALFGGDVRCFSIEEHEAPPLALLVAFCDAASAFLAQDERNVVAVHCRAGTGRTGVLVSALLLHSGAAESAADALQAFAAARTLDGRAVTLPSQRRYVEYYAALRAAGGPLPPVPMQQRCMEVRVKLPSNTAPPTLRLWQRGAGGALEPLAGCSGIRQSRAGADVVYALPAAGFSLEGDVRLTLEERGASGTSVLCYAWLHTSCLPRGGRVAFTRADVDKPKASLPEDFSLRVRFAAAPPPAAPAPPLLPSPETSLRMLAAARARPTAARPAAPPPVAAAPSPLSARLSASAAAASQSLASPSVPAASSAPAAERTAGLETLVQRLQCELEDMRAEAAEEAKARRALDRCACPDGQPPVAPTLRAPDPELLRSRSEMQRMRLSLAATPPSSPAFAGAAATPPPATPVTPPLPSAAQVAAALSAAAEHIRMLNAALAQEQATNAELRAQLARDAAPQADTSPRTKGAPA